MAQITINERKLKNLFREVLKEILSVEFMKLRAELVPFVSEKEQKEIEKKYGKPTRKVKKSIQFEL